MSLMSELYKRNNPLGHSDIFLKNLKLYCVGKSNDYRLDKEVRAKWKKCYHLIRQKDNPARLLELLEELGVTKDGIPI